MKKIVGLSRAKIFFWGCVSFVFGVLFASFLPEDLVGLKYFWFLVVVLLVFGFAVIRRSLTRNILIWVVFFFLAVLRYSVSVVLVDVNHVRYYNAEAVDFVGVVKKEVIVRNSYQQLVVGVDQLKIEHEDDWNDVRGKVLVSADLYPLIKYGDRVRVLCELKKPKALDGFRYDRYLAKMGIYSICYYPKLVILEDDLGNLFFRKILYVKGVILDVINRNMSEPSAGLVRAIFMGDKQGVANELRESFSRSGISHIVAISGMHVGIIAGILMWLLMNIGFRRQLAFWVAVIFLGLYVVMVGAPSSAVRAFVMGFMVLFAVFLGRLNSIRNSLAFASFVLLMINPRLLRDDVGFQLSFLAVGSIVLYYPLFDGFFKKYIELIDNKMVCKYVLIVSRVVSVTLSAQVLVMPLIVYMFGVVPNVAVISNLLVLWVVPILMVGIILAVIVSLVIPMIGFLLFFVVSLLLEYIIFISEVLTGLPYAYFKFNDINMGWVLMVYFMIIVFSIWLGKRKYM